MMDRILDSASCALVPAWDRPEVYLVHRAAGIKVFPDAWTFPGGKVEKTDRTVPVEGAEGEAAAFHACVVREIFEETGVLLAQGAPGPERRTRLRKALLEGRSSFRRVLREARVKLRAEDIVQLGTKTTPPMTPWRFRNRFCMAVVPSEQQPEVWPGELDQGAWLLPADVLRRWARVDMRIAPPVLLMLERWGRDAASARESLIGFDDEYFRDRLPRVQFAPGVVLAAQHTVTVPPATSTNTYVVGEERLYVVDPGSPDAAEQARLSRLLDELAVDGRRLEAVLLTHEHSDHVGGLEFLAGGRGLPVYAHPLALDRLAVGRGLDLRPLNDHAALPLDRDGRWRLETVHTPGHAPGHLSWYDGIYGTLLVGDMVSTVSTVVIDPDLGGDMAAYMASLKRLLELPARTLYPAHGVPTPEVKRVLQGYIDHRLEREKAFLAAVGKKPKNLDKLLVEVYADTHPDLHPLARKSLRALAAMLETRGQVVQRDGVWAAA